MALSDWHLDWSDFAQLVAQLHDDGLSDEAISQQLGGQSVTWTGIVLEIALAREHVPGVAFQMHTKQLVTTTSGPLKADYLFVGVEQPESWAGVTPGSVVRFETTLDEGTGPFPGISVSLDDDEPEALLLVGAKRGTVVAT